MRPQFSSLSFQDPGRAEANLARLAQQLAPSLITPLASLLEQSPDPDGALNLLERYVQAAPAAVLEELPRYPAALTYLVAIFGYSPFLAETFLSEPGLPVQFARDRNFTRLKSKEDLMQDYARFSTTSPDPWLSTQLARFKRRNYLRIVLKDVLGVATVGEVTLELSTLADVILANALAFCDRELEKRYGQPQYRDAQGRIVRCGFSIVSLGKLGGNELNYSSDIDLLFLYSQDGETAGTGERGSVISNKGYAVHQAHAAMRTITLATPQGQVFRVDLRLRPEGNKGDAAISLAAALEYYKRRASQWELQMLIKARHSAGDAQLTREFIRGVEPYVYGTSTHFETVESALRAREKVSKRLRGSHAGLIDVKRHGGGIRDIEFLTQCLQRLHGGRDPWVRSGGTLQALRRLNDKGSLSDSEFAALTSCYEFCRKVEHRIQLEHGEQTHHLPTEREALGRLARRVGVAYSPGEEPGQALLRRLREGFARVDEIYQRAVHPPLADKAGIAFALEPLLKWPAEAGPGSYEVMLAYLDAQSPALAGLLREFSLPERSRKNATRLFASLLGSSERFRWAQLKPGRVRHALEMATASEYLAELLVHYPDDLGAVDSPESPAPAPTPEVEAAQMEMGLEKPAGAAPFLWVGEAGLGAREKMTLLRRQYRTRVLELAAADLAGLGSVFLALRHWSSLAVKSISSALWIAAEALNLGPRAAGLSPCSAGFPLVVLGLGRLGLNEFDLGSDADLVFVVAAEAAREETALWTRLAEKTIELLSNYTGQGTLFSVDTRLGLRGQKGELVISDDVLLSYFSDAAQPWEALTCLKAFPVAGSLDLGRRVTARLVGNGGALFTRSAAYADLAGEIHEMRRRAEREAALPSTNKTAPGGYDDVDFAVSFLRLRHAVSLPPGANIAEQVTALGRTGLINAEDSHSLTQGAAFLRSLDHAVRLVTGKSAPGLPEHPGHAEAVESLARRWGLLTGNDSLARRLRDTQQQVRYVYRRLVGSE